MRSETVDVARPAGLTVGIVGAGQLARMCLTAAEPLGVTVRLLAEAANESAALVGKHVDIGSPQSADALRRFAQSCDVITFDHELVNAGALSALEREGHLVRPSARVVALVQDKRAQRELLRGLALPVPNFVVVDGPETFARFAGEHGWPIVAKAIRGGYDGRGVWILGSPEDADRLMTDVAPSTPLVLEAWVPIEREVAMIIARRPNADTAVFPLVETVQVEGICRELRVPAADAGRVGAEAERIARTIAEAIRLEGLLAVELFVTAEGLVVNELAARPHNSGHFSIEGCRTSQFAQHLRAVLDLPLGDTALTAPAVATVNLLGGAAPVAPEPALRSALALPATFPHLYGKTHRAGRKLGHVTAVGEAMDEALGRARRAAALLVGDEEPRS